MNNREAFEAWWNGRGLPEGLKPAFYMVWQAALASQANVNEQSQAQQPNTNQRLIDAAPDLLDALKTVLAAHKEKPPTTVMQAEAVRHRMPRFT